MKIGIVTGEYPPLQGGVGAYTRRLAETFQQQETEAVVFTTAESKSSAFVTHTVQSWQPMTLWSIRQWAKHEHLDVLNIQFQTAAFNMSPWIHFLPYWIGNIPVVTTFHDLRFPYLFPKAGNLRKWIVNHLASSSDGIIVTNHEDEHNIKHLKKVLIPIGSNIPVRLPSDYDRREWRAKVGASNGEALIAHFGFVNHSKGIDTLIESMQLLKRRGEAVKLIMIGGKTGSSDPTNVAYVNNIEVLIEQLGLNDDVYWTGFVDDSDVAAYLKTADMIVLPFRDGASYRRGSLMAAIQHECAIVTTTPTIPISAFRHGENMWLIEPDQPESLAKGIQHLLQSPDLQRRLHDNVHHLKHEFDWNNIADAYIQFFKVV